MTAPAITREMLHAASLAAWLVDIRPTIKIGGRDLSFKTHPYLVDFLDDQHPDQVIIKGAQLGWTTAAELKILCEMSRKNLRGALYLFPRQDDIADFSRARLNPLIQENPVFRAMVQDTDAMSLKRIGNGNLYLRHIGGEEAGIKSIDCDRVVYDERDEMDDDKVILADHRLDSSNQGVRIEFSTPTTPDFGVDASYKASDGMVWKIRCGNSGCHGSAGDKANWTCLELTWPNCLIRVGDRVIRACSRCKQEIHVNDGEWVAQWPTVTKKRGRWISQLCGSAPRQQPDFILNAFEEAQISGKLKEFNNSVLGLPYAEIDQQLTEAQLRSLCEPNETRATASAGPTFLGADVGGRTFHWIVGERRSYRLDQIIGWGVAGSEDEMSDVVKRFRVSQAVFDGMAEVRSVRELKKRHPGVIWENHYTMQKSDAAWNTDTMTVTVNRTASLDDSHKWMADMAVRFPRLDQLALKEVFPQILNLVRRVRVRSKETGQTLAIWSCHGPKNDHFRHALNYARMASLRVGLAASANKRQRTLNPPARWVV